MLPGMPRWSDSHLALKIFHIELWSLVPQGFPLFMCLFPQNGLTKKSPDAKEVWETGVRLPEYSSAEGRNRQHQTRNPQVGA